MDKIKPYLALLKKHHFWILAVVVVMLCSYAWYSGTAAYDQQFMTSRSQIQSAFSAADSVRNAQNPPNQSFADGLQGVKNEQINSTLSAWQTLYDRQKGILVWSIANDRLANLKPEDEIPKDIRDVYLNYFATSKEYWPKVFEIIDPLRVEEAAADPAANQPAANNQPANRPAASGGLGSRLGGGLGSRLQARPGQPGGANAPNQRTVGLVEWPESERNAIQDRYRWQTTPTSMQVRMAQEDFWLYKAVLEVIANANKSAGSTRHENAAIKKILALGIAQGAGVPTRPTIDKLPTEAMPAVDSAAAPKLPGPNSPDEELVAGRYATGDAAGGGAAGGTEFKMVPVSLRLTMDERRIPNLLVACANSPLPIEVQQVLYNPGAGGGASGGSAPMRSGLSLGGGSMSPRPSAPVAASKGETRSDATMYDATVEIRGVIYLFNAPSRTALGLTEEAPADGSTDPTVGAPVPTEPVADPNPVPADPNAAAPLDPNAAPVDPNAVPVAPNATPADPNAVAPADPNATPAVEAPADVPAEAPAGGEPAAPQP